MTMEIQSVQQLDNGSYLINGVLAVPADPANMDYRRVVDWIAEGNEPDAPPQAEPVVEEVTRFQALMALDQFGLYDDVVAYMADAETPRATVIAFENAQVFRRSSPLLRDLATQFDLSEEQLDAMFSYAVSVVA